MIVLPILPLLFKSCPNSKPQPMRANCLWVWVTLDPVVSFSFWVMGLNIGTTALEVLFQTLLTLVDKWQRRMRGLNCSCHWMCWNGSQRYLPPCQRWRRTWCKAGSVRLPLGRLCNLGGKPQEKGTLAGGEPHAHLERTVLNNYLILSQKVVGAEIDWHPFPTGSWTESKKWGKLRKKKKKKKTWKNPESKNHMENSKSMGKEKPKKTSSIQVQGVTAAPQKMQLLHKWVHNRKEAVCTELQLEERQDPMKHFTLPQRRAPRYILWLVFLFKSKLVFTALLANPQLLHPLCPLFCHVPWALGEGLDRDTPPTLNTQSFCTEPQQWAAF